MEKFVFFLPFVVFVLVKANHEHHHAASLHHEHEAAYVVKTHDDLIRYRNLCAEQVNANVDAVDKYKQWKYPDDETTRCYLKCVFEQFGFFDANKGFDVHKVHEQLAGGSGTVDHNDETHTKIESCADNNSQGSDACTWAYRGGMCFLRSNLQLVKQSVHS
ncbi:general odorant-binding protein 99b [Scaptodrosophila lebanonensis]|uniref:General odorant-binding protein 99b n=1 Tax=Drosophila lebanonensis TaxID=7225 RepID=A0A6J2SZB4_DROLE|nr:general odorant-binding protein 99b [Scaptodrosophila lebanonensis]